MCSLTFSIALLVVVGATWHSGEAATTTPSSANCTTSTFDGALWECASQLGISAERVRTENHNLLLYTADPETACLARCIGLLLRFWDDETGLRESTIRQYYRPDPEDHCYRNRTQRCLRTYEKDTTLKDVCERAQRAFLCYHQQYGYLQQEERFIPLTGHEMRQVQQDCLDILGLAPSRLTQYTEGYFPDDPETHCFVRCVGLRTRLYNDRTGPEVDRLYIQCDSCVDEHAFKERANACIASQRLEKRSKCSTAYRTLYHCFRDDQLELYADQRNVQGTTQKPIPASRSPVFYPTKVPVTAGSSNKLVPLAPQRTNKKEIVFKMIFPMLDHHTEQKRQRY
ncbi:general odorant-binding protein 45-like [Anopheles aquasalis]|uniref:general odorant-binding protein 45-like n=1 Tax=Anopheles aquasalis TaxID=42839 RepID=UPI00215B403B|nr:general odorant-binding protein 45-like [Anopheles aquasalis]